MLRKASYFEWTLLFICLTYLCIEFFYTRFAALSADEFWFAHHIYQFKLALPYRDFAPYKTVLGYYFLLPTLTFTESILKSLWLIKDWITIINTTLLFIAALWLSRFFSKTSILISVSLLLFADFFLLYSTNIRVDLLGFWFCLFSALCLLEKRFILSGLLLGTSFLISQKTLWYFFATNVALGSYWLFLSRNRNTFLSLIALNIVALLPIALYILFWAFQTNFEVVFKSMFYEAYLMYHLDTYASARHFFWEIILVHNPLLFLLWPLSFLSLLITYPEDSAYSNRFIITFYSASILLCLMPFKQVFPYYMLAAAPAFLLLYTAFFSWAIHLFKSSPQLRLINPFELQGLTALYLVTLGFMIQRFHLPLCYSLIALIPLLINLFILHPLLKRHALLLLHLIGITVFFVGFFYPLLIFSIALPPKNNQYQKAMMNEIQLLLNDKSNYFAGIELVYNLDQPVKGLRHLDAPAIEYLYRPNPLLQKAMLASLYHEPNITISSAIQTLEQTTPKFYVNNYRIEALPSRIRNYLFTHYTHFWGSIYLYAPMIPPNQHTLSIAYTGYYELEAINPITLDTVHYGPHALLLLTKGLHQYESPNTFRLKLIPNNGMKHLDPLYQKDEWNKLLL